MKNFYCTLYMAPGVYMSSHSYQPVYVFFTLNRYSISNEILTRRTNERTNGREARAHIYDVQLGWQLKYS